VPAVTFVIEAVIAFVFHRYEYGGVPPEAVTDALPFA
jgi:hypothetical protein